MSHSRSGVPNVILFHEHGPVGEIRHEPVSGLTAVWFHSSGPKPIPDGQNVLPPSVTGRLPNRNCWGDGLPEAIVRRLRLITAVITRSSPSRL